jgi:diguanylate cyclase (GGDEF)-like protein/PAS domain S-box-containing protein
VTASHAFLQPAARRLPSLQTAVLVAGAVLLVALLATVHYLLRAEYRNEVDAIIGDSERTAHKLAARTSEVFDRVNESTLLVKYLHERGYPVQLQSLRFGGVLADDVTRSVLLADAKGFVLDSTSSTAALNIADEDDFKLHKRQMDLDVTIGLPALNPVAGGWGIPVSRRLNQGGGGFAGLVTADVNPAALSAQYAKSEASDTAIGVLGLDGIYRSRMLAGKVSFGEKVDVASLLRRTSDLQQLRQPAKSPIDGIERFVVSVRVAKYPLLAVVAVNADSALAGYRHARDSIIGWAAAVAGLVIVCLLLLRAKVVQLERSRLQTRRAETTLRATLEGSLDAVSILQAERDGQGRLIDLVIADSNARAAALIGRSRDEVIGQRLCSLTPTIRTEGFLDRFEQVIRSGRASQAEVQATEPALAGRWLHHQVVPLDDGIALITRDVTERKQAEQMMASLARLDALTQLGNRRDFEHRLGEAQARTLRSGQALALLYLDLDGFKRVNDTLGHAAGDELLVSVAQRLRDSVRQTDTVNRLGGDEFTVTLEGAGTVRNVCDLCARIVELLSQPHVIAGQSVVCTPSIGAAMLLPGDSQLSLQRRADAAMYGAKHAGKAQYRLAPEMLGEADLPAPPGSGAAPARPELQALATG